MKHYYVSLIDVTGFVKAQYRDIVLMALNNNRDNNQPQLRKQTWVLDHIPFMELLLREIFEQQPGRPGSVLGRTKSASYLMEQGLNSEQATYLSAEAFKQVVDTLSIHVPGIEFNNEERFAYGLCDEYDILVTDNGEMDGANLADHTDS